MTARSTAIAAAIVVGLSCGVARAQLAVTDPVAEGLLAKQVQTLSGSLYQQIKSVADLGIIIENLRAVLRTSNEVVALARFSKRVYDAARRYTVQDLKRDALEGLRKAAPELVELEDEVQLTIANAKSIEHGPKSFFAMQDYRDENVQRTIAATADQALQATVYSQIFPKLFEKQAAAGVTEADRLVAGRFLRTGQFGRYAAESAASAAMAKRVNEVVNEGETQQRTDLSLLGYSARAQMQMMIDLRAVAEFEKTKAALEEDQRRKEETRGAVLRQTVGNEIGEQLLSPGRKIH